MMIDTPRQGHQPIEMHRVSGYTEVKQVGDFYWNQPSDTTGRYLAFAIPRAGNNLNHWLFQNLSVQLGSNITGWCWGWDGNEDKPTLMPSIHAIGHWHGWVRDGMLIEA